MLTCSELSVRADRSEHLILEGINAAFPAKQLNALVGPSGCGKTTLLKAFLGLELVSSPECLICDEVTSGLDPLSEDQIIALLRSLVEAQGKTFICTIHNLGKLPDFDHITVLYEGRLVFQGDFEALKAWFEIEDPLKLYHALAERPLDEWLEKWNKATQERGDPGNANLRIGSVGVSHGAATQERGDPGLPSATSQLFTLLRRRYQLLLRDTGYLWLLLALTFGFPCIVVIFAIAWMRHKRQP